MADDLPGAAIRPIVPTTTAPAGGVAARGAVATLGAPPTSSGHLLEVRDLVRHFGGVKAVDHASFGIEAGTISALIGPNGAGKTTTVDLIAGALRPQSGQVLFDGHDLAGKRPHQIAERRLIRTFQISREYAAMTVLENLMVSPLDQAGERLVNVLFRPGRYQREERQHLERALGVLEDFGLYAKRDDYAGSLSGGQKRLLELARAVMADPKLLLLDEPMAGINPALTDRVADHIIRMKQELAVTFLIVEHNLEIVERICDHVVVLALGATLATGTMSELRSNEAVVAAYLTGGGA